MAILKSFSWLGARLTQARKSSPLFFQRTSWAATSLQYEFGQLAHEPELLDLGQKLQWADEAMLRVAPTYERLGFPGLPLFAGAALDFWLVFDDELALTDSLIEILSRQPQHAAPAGPGGGAQAHRNQIGVHPLEVIELGQLLESVATLLLSFEAVACQPQR